MQLVQHKLENPNCAHSHLPHSFRSLYSYLILYQTKILVPIKLVISVLQIMLLIEPKTISII